jgi:PAS domain S-box-containing protein
MDGTVASRSVHGLTLGTAASAVTLAILVLRAAGPSDDGVRVATAAALVIGLGAVFALWINAMRQAAARSSDVADPDRSRSILAAIPDGLMLVEAGSLRSVNDSLCGLVGLTAEELLGAGPPLPFCPPEHAHEVEAWLRELDERGEHHGELTVRHRDGRRLRVLVSGRTLLGGDAPRHLITVRDASPGHERERRLLEVATRDVETGLLDAVEFERRLGDAVRRALPTGANVAVVLAELDLADRARESVFHSPEAIRAVDRLRALLRAGDELARTGDRELALILPDTDAHGGVGTVARARTGLADLDQVTLTAGICDLAAAGDALALYAYADRALAQARRQGVGGTVQYSTVPGAAS